MKSIFIFLSIILPIVLWLLTNKYPTSRKFLDLLAFFSLLVFGNIAAISIYEIIRDDAVFMTRIHAIFLNPLFLVTGAYLGIYTLFICASLIISKN